MRFMAFSTHGNHLFFCRGQFLIFATISKKCPYFATRLCFHGNPGNQGNSFLAKIFSVPLAWQNILTFWQLIWRSHNTSVTNKIKPKVAKLGNFTVAFVPLDEVVFTFTSLKEHILDFSTLSRLGYKEHRLPAKLLPLASFLFLGTVCREPFAAWTELTIHWSRSTTPSATSWRLCFRNKLKLMQKSWRSPLQRIGASRERIAEFMISYLRIISIPFVLHT